MANTNNTAVAQTSGEWIHKHDLEEISGDLDGQLRSVNYLFLQLIQWTGVREAHDYGALLGCVAASLRETQAKLDLLIDPPAKGGASNE